LKAGVIDVDIENPDIKIPQTLEIPINDRKTSRRVKVNNFYFHPPGTEWSDGSDELEKLI
jgi:hypothetical protein